MIFAIWLMVTLLALSSSVLGLLWRWPFLLLPAGLLWIIAGMVSVDVEFNIVYTGSDYLKDFTYSYLTMLFSFIGLVCFGWFGLHVFEVMRGMSEG